jgi:hypothetical protein
MTHGFANLVASQYSGKKEDLSRSKQFAIIQPSTATRVDLGLNLKGEDTTDRLESKNDVNAELKKWLKEAFLRA